MKNNLKIMDRRIYYLSILIFIAMIPSLLHAQKTSLNDSLKIEKIINKLQNKNLKGQVITVNNPADVAFISSFINKTGNQPLQREKTYIINDSKTVGGRYKQGDKKTIPEVMKILNSSDNEIGRAHV